MMRIVIREIHAARKAGELNDEWLVVENAGDRAYSTAGCTVSIARGKGGRLRSVGTLDPGFLLAPGDRVRLVTGNAGKKAHGKVPVPVEGERNYHLFLGGPLLPGPGAVVVLSMHQHELARATFDPKAESGVAAEAEAEGSGSSEDAGKSDAQAEGA
jgi:hypothetical protein